MIENDISVWKEQLKDFLKVHKLPPNEKLLLRQANENHEVVFFVTCNKMIGQYYLYKIKDGKSKKVKTSDTIDFKELEV